MEVSPDDLKLPQAVITRLIKEALPEGVIVSKVRTEHLRNCLFF
jgi:histone H3/H4